MSTPRPINASRASEELMSCWNELIEVPEGFWEESEHKTVLSSRRSLEFKVTSRRWMHALAACLVGGILIWGWSESNENTACITFACIWEAQADVPLTSDELRILEQWESGHDDLTFYSLSAQ